MNTNEKHIGFHGEKIFVSIRVHSWFKNAKIKMWFMLPFH